MKNDIAELKKEMKDLIGGGASQIRDNDDAVYIPQDDDYSQYVTISDHTIVPSIHTAKVDNIHHDSVIDSHEIPSSDSLSLTESEYNLIKKALLQYKKKYLLKQFIKMFQIIKELQPLKFFKRISERTLYRKLKEYNITR